MAEPHSKPVRSKPARSKAGRAGFSLSSHLPSKQPLASPWWIAGALLATLGLAVVCLYAAICLLFWQGQWQMVFHPSRTITATPASAGLHYDDIRFDATETGILQLAGWWVPAEPGARYAADTILYLHGGSGSLSDSVDELKALHALGINVFAFDYRGFGKSRTEHPSERSVGEDADAAWRYLTDTRHLAPGTIIIEGAGLGAAIAAEAARRHPQAAAVILKNPQPPTLQMLEANPRTRILPLRLLFHDRFDPAPTLRHLTLPKLFLSAGAGSKSAVEPLYYREAAAPKTEILLSEHDAGYAPELRRFLGDVFP